jgi:hypothetical protein
MPDDRFLHASRRRERQARRTVTLITAVVATRWICADLAVAWPIQAASVVGFAVLFTGIAELVRGES